jgi:protein-glutamine gamma-glutamyltransferase
MNLETYFKLTSYAVVACGGVALFVAGGLNSIIFIIFCFALIAFYFLENTKWQISEKMGLLVIVLAMPLFYFNWQFLAQSLSREQAGAATLAQLILGLSIVKLWQKKTDRDWIFLYLISFFEVLLAAGLSITPAFFGVLVLFLLFAISTVIVFEIRKSSRNITVLKEQKIFRSKKKSKTIFKLQTSALIILFLITIIAVPLFFVMPRANGGGGLGRGNGLSGFVGFSDTVELGAIGKLQQNNQVVMRVKIDGAPPQQNLRWRGVALDYFDNKVWRNTAKNSKEVLVANKYGAFQTGSFKKSTDLTMQTVFLEPIDRSVLFGASRAVAYEGKFPFLMRDEDDAVFFTRRSSERILYKVYSDVSAPNINTLRRDAQPYALENARYLQLPENFDARIEKLASEIVKNAGATNRFDAAAALENYLQTQFGYTLEQKAGNSPEPLAKFLFEIREGHCEYFASAMTIMLRTQGIAARVINGFQAGTYNDAAGMYIVGQSQAHSWVEVYFPETDTWTTFDPTPAAGRESGAAGSGNFLASQFNKYVEALEIFWLQYVVGFDNQEQRSLVRNLRNNLADTQQSLASIWESIQNAAIDWWLDARGDKGAATTVWALLRLFGFLLFAVTIVFIVRFGAKRLRGGAIWNIITFWRRGNGDKTKVVEFYERMNRTLSERGLHRQPQQTPLEFAASLTMPEALKITEAYHRVRFGDEILSTQETANIEAWLKSLEPK